MQFLTKPLRSLITSRARQQSSSWVLSQQCHSTKSSSCEFEKSEPKPPKPTTIPYQPKSSNSIDLVGYVIQPVQFHNHPDGKLWADTVISHRSSSDPEPESDPSRNFRIPVIFQGDLAQTANCHLKEDDRIHVTGQAFVDACPSGDNPAKEYLKVLVNDFNYIWGGGSKAKPQVLPSSYKKEGVLKHSANVDRRVNFESGHWFDLLDKSEEWCDYRERKLNGSVSPKHPDFKKKDGSEALWLTSAPKEILSDLKDVRFDIPARSTYTKQPKAGEESWEDLVENINNWWDNRLDKKNPKSPDFKHRKTGVKLWLSDSPRWVIEKLPSPKSKASDSYKEHELF